MLGFEMRACPFSLAPRSSLGDVLGVLRWHGIVVMHDYLESSQVADLSAACGKLFDDTASWIHHEEYSLGKSVRMERAEIDRTGYAALSDVFSEPYLEDVAGGYFGDGCIFSRTIYAIYDVVGTSTKVQELHYDKMRHLKIFFYLTDVDISRGPFRCVPGSHVQCASMQASKRLRRIVPTDEEVRNMPEDYFGRDIPISGGAGTLILFDSDIAHRASAPTGGDRLAVRSLSFGSYRRETWFKVDGTVQEP
jgi:ectoine hydroxylase-related dioxygenase (phytanoyl-CoA dioxygenase family)